MNSLPPDPYKVLDIERDAAPPQIKRAYRILVLKCHPDKVQDPALKAARQDEFQRVQQAYELLSDERARAEYDAKVRLASLKERDKLAGKTTTPTYRTYEARGGVRTPFETYEASPRSSYSNYATNFSPRTAKLDSEREDFIAFALKLFDEAKKDKKPEAPSSGGSETEPPPAPSHEFRRGSKSIEEEIRERNKAFEDLKASASNQPTSGAEDAKKSRTSPEAAASSPDKPAQTEKLYTVPVEQLNFQIMNPDNENARVDIVAVHGLGAIPDITWKEKTSGINWLSHKDMLPRAVPEARILRFGYDSLWKGPNPIRTSLSTIAYKLLMSLNMIRMEDLERPLIFVGHCFGGLVIERALNLAKMQHNAYPGVFDSSIGIVFLGTPHRGTQSFTPQSALLAAIAAGSDLYEKLETGVLDALAAESGNLLEVADDFITLAVDGGPMISCFYEQRASKLGKVIGRNDIQEFIVDSTSATFDGHRKYGLELDHFSLNKFNGPNNPNYKLVLSEIIRFYNAALRKLQQSTAQSSLEGSKSPSDSVSTSKAAAGRVSVSQAWNQLGRSRTGHNQRSASPRVPTSESRHRHGVTRQSRAEETPDNQAEGRPSSAQGRSLPREKEEELRKEAIKELHEEEAQKQAAAREEEYQKRLVEERRAAKQAAEQEYIERIKKNMIRYEIENPEEIIKANPLPKDEDLTVQEVKDKEKWYKNCLEGALSAQGLGTGIIDEILNDTGETMVADGIETTFTRMAGKWVSTRTLDSYHIPWELDKEDPSSIIIKRWVPDYEKAFLWDHSQALREGRGRRRTRRDDEQAKNADGQRAGPEKDWVLRMWESFKVAQTGKSSRNSDLNDSERRQNKEERRRREKEEWEREERRMAKKTEREREERRRGQAESKSKRPDPYGAAVSDDEYSRRATRSYRTTTPTQATVPNYASHRKASTESMRSAPDSEEVARRRRHSRTLSGDRARPSSRQASTERPSSRAAYRF